MFKENLSDFIDDRLNATIKKLKHDNINYIAEFQEYHKLYRNLYNELNTDQKIKLERLFNILNSISSTELEAAYITAIQDIIKINNPKFIDSIK